MAESHEDDGSVISKAKIHAAAKEKHDWLVKHGVSEESQVARDHFAEMDRKAREATGSQAEEDTSDEPIVTDAQPKEEDEEQSVSDSE